jgi:hypothetical protein
VSAWESLAGALRSGRFPKEAKKTTPTICPLEESVGRLLVLLLPTYLVRFSFLFFSFFSLKK